MGRLIKIRANEMYSTFNEYSCTDKYLFTPLTTVEIIFDVYENFSRQFTKTFYFKFNIRDLDCEYRLKEIIELGLNDYEINFYAPKITAEHHKDDSVVVQIEPNSMEIIERLFKNYKQNGRITA